MEEETPAGEVEEENATEDTIEQEEVEKKEEEEESEIDPPIVPEATTVQVPDENHPYVKAGKERILKLQQDLRMKHEQARNLISFLDQRHVDAKKKDEEEVLEGFSFP